MTAASPDYEGLQHDRFLPQTEADARTYDLFACFPSSASADQALAALRLQGAGNGDARLLGTPSDLVSGVGFAEADKRTLSTVLRYLAVGWVLGALIGATIAVVILAIPAFQSVIGSPITSGSYLVAALLGALFGSSLGVVGGILGLDRADRGRDPSSDGADEGIAMVAVHAADDAQRRALSDMLSGAGAFRVQRLQDGRPVPPCGFPCAAWNLAPGEAIPCAMRDVRQADLA